MARQRVGSKRPYRLNRYTQLPEDASSKLAQGRRLVREIEAGYQHFKRNPAHYRDSPARRRLERNLRRLREILDALKRQNPQRAGELEEYMTHELEARHG